MLQVVNDLLELLDADAESLHDIPSWHYKDERLAESSKITLFELLTYCYDLRYVPGQNLLLMHRSLPMCLFNLTSMLLADLA